MSACRSAPVYDAIVVGLGGAGSAALYHLAKQGAKVLGLERFTIAHDQGSSHGQTRIIRGAYHEGHQYVPLLQRSWDLFEALQVSTDIPCLHQTGCLGVGHQLVKQCQDACDRYGLEYTLLGPEEVLRQFPGYHVHEEALLASMGGILESENCIQAHVSAAQKHGARVSCNTKVTSWAVDQDGTVTVQDSAGVQHTAERMVLCVGAWSSQLIPELEGYLQPERQVVAWFDVDESESRMHYTTHPVCIMMHSNGGAYYSFPQFGAQNGFKIGRMHHLNEPTDPDAVRRDIVDRDIDVMREALSDCFPTANGKVLKASTCMFTNTPDFDFLLDKHPRFPQVVVVSACSGHGFKFTSGIGEAAAELLTHGTTTCDVSMFQLHPDRKGASEVLQRFNAS